MTYVLTAWSGISVQVRVKVRAKDRKKGFLFILFSLAVLKNDDTCCNVVCDVMRLYILNVGVDFIILLCVVCHTGRRSPPYSATEK